MTLPDQTARAEGRASLAFLGFLALMTSVVAMTIDAVLPALGTDEHQAVAELVHRSVGVDVGLLDGEEVVAYGSVVDNATNDPTTVPIKTVTVAARMPRPNAAFAPNISWERMSRPSGSVPSQCAAEMPALMLS